MPKRNTAVAATGAAYAGLIRLSHSLLLLTAAVAISQGKADSTLLTTGEVALDGLWVQAPLPLVELFAALRGGYTSSAGCVPNATHLFFSCASAICLTTVVLTINNMETPANVLTLNKQQTGLVVPFMLAGYVLLAAKDFIGSCIAGGFNSGRGGITMTLSGVIAGLAGLFATGVLAGVLGNEQNGLTDQTMVVEHTKEGLFWWDPPITWSTTEQNHNMANSAGLAGAGYFLSAIMSFAAAGCAKIETRANGNRPRGESELVRLSMDGRAQRHDALLAAARPSRRQSRHRAASVLSQQGGDRKGSLSAASILSEHGGDNANYGAMDGNGSESDMEQGGSAAAPNPNS